VVAWDGAGLGETDGGRRRLPGCVCHMDQTTALHVRAGVLTHRLTHSRMCTWLYASHRSVRLPSDAMISCV